MRQQKFGNVRDADFADLLAYYLVDLLAQGHEGTFLLADAQAGELRDLAEDLAPVLPSRFARGLREILAKHDELRGYYVEIPNVDKAANQSQPLPTPPPAPLLRLQEALRNASPEAVTAELVEQTKQVLRAAPTIELDEDDRRRASSPDIVHQSPRPPGAPSARQRHAYNVATLLAKLNKLAGVSNLKDGVASVGALHNVDKFREMGFGGARWGGSFDRLRTRAVGGQPRRFTTLVLRRPEGASKDLPHHAGWNWPLDEKRGLR